jgi:elongation factor 1-gamma
VFARDAQIYLLALISGSVSSEIHARAREGFMIYAAGVNQALSPDREFIVGENLSMADICFVAELSLFCNESTRHAELRGKGLAPVLHATIEKEFPRAFAHFSRLCKHPAFAPDVAPYLAKIEALKRQVSESTMPH